MALQKQHVWKTVLFCDRVVQAGFQTGEAAIVSSSAVQEVMLVGCVQRGDDKRGPTVQLVKRFVSWNKSFPSGFLDGSPPLLLLKKRLLAVL